MKYVPLGRVTNSNADVGVLHMTRSALRRRLCATCMANGSWGQRARRCRNKCTAMVDGRLRGGSNQARDLQGRLVGPLWPDRRQGRPAGGGNCCCGLATDAAYACRFGHGQVTVCETGATVVVVCFFISWYQLIICRGTDGRLWEPAVRGRGHSRCAGDRSGVVAPGTNRP